MDRGYSEIKRTLQCTEEEGNVCREGGREGGREKKTELVSQYNTFSSVNIKICVVPHHASADNDCKV